MKEFLTAENIQNILEVGQAKAYEIIRELNEELKQEGYKVIKGKVSRARFEEKYIYKTTG
ncbi:ICEBs1 excisionase [Bacillus subtilis]|uniref:ICEBs1 excisionase n=1 Tax=Bacillus subtilis TaxID=1423 RepID=UPI0040561510